jgi:hypothetical protein
MTEFTPDVTLPDDVFIRDGTMSTRHREDVAAEIRTGQWLNETALPMPHWWPRGLGYHGHDGDPATGAYRVMLEVPGFPELCRWPAGTPRPVHWAEKPHLHRWHDDHREWALGVDQPLGEQDPARLVDSIPPG